MIGRKLADRYELLERIGGGGMAVVYKAKDALLDRLVAVKILRPQYALDDNFVHRFRREAQAAAKLSHPNVVSIFDVGVVEDIHYIVMEFVEGTTLKEYINKYAPLDSREAVEITKQIAEALDHAHQHKIIHRDIKPHNILIGRNNRVKVTDFGIARAVSSSTITHTGSVIGSVHYFSPEQARGAVTGEKSDIYSLGIVLYEMVTGTLPFSGDSPISIALMHVQEAYTEPRQINPAIPQSVENIILRSLAKDPLQRYASAAELIADLNTCLNPERLNDKKLILDDQLDDEATKIMPALNIDAYGTKTVEQDDEHDEDWDDDWEEPKSSRTIWRTIGISVFILFVLLFGLYLGFKFISNLFYVEEIILEDVTNVPLEEAINMLAEQNLNVNHTHSRHSDDIEEGYVISQSPSAGTPVKENSYVSLTVSLGKEKETMPRLISLPLETALRYVSEDFKEVIHIEEASSEVTAGYVIRQEPKAGETVVPSDTVVTLYVSTGAEKVIMPDLIGRTLMEAEAELTRHKLVLDPVIESDYSDFPEGQVYRQEPVQPGEEIDAGASVKLWVSKGYRETYREKIIEVPVTLEEYEFAHVSIFISDENGDKRVIDEIIYQSKTYNLSVKVSRERSGQVQVFINDELFLRKDVTFD